MIDENNVETVSALTNLPCNILRSIYDKLLLVSSHEIIEQKNKGVSVYLVDVAGFGKIKISAETEGVRYQFIPSTEFANIVKETLLTGESKLVTRVEEKVINQINSLYKELL